MLHSRGIDNLPWKLAIPNAVPAVRVLLRGQPTRGGPVLKFLTSSLSVYRRLLTHLHCMLLTSKLPLSPALSGLGSEHVAWRDGVGWSTPQWDLKGSRAAQPSGVPGGPRGRCTVTRKSPSQASTVRRGEGVKYRFAANPTSSAGCVEPNRLPFRRLRGGISLSTLFSREYSRFSKFMRSVTGRQSTILPGRVIVSYSAACHLFSIGI